MGLDVVELFMEMESAFGISIPNADAERLTTVGSLYDYIAIRVAPSIQDIGGGPYSGELWERYLNVIERELSVPRSDVLPGARFVEDLGAN